MSDVLKDYNDLFEQDVSAPEISSEQISRITELARKQLEYIDEVERLETHLNATKKELNKISMIDLPEAMNEAQLKSFTLVSGESIEIKPIIRASISKANQSEAFQWLEENDLGDLIKNIFTVCFGRGDGEKANLLGNLLNEAGFDFENKQSVNSQSLSAIVRRKLEEGVDLPEDLLGIFSAQLAKITKRSN